MDAVITYVNCLDVAWQQSYKENVDAPLNVERFRDWGTLPYLLRGIEKYMPFIKNVFLVVASETQVPTWASENLNIVLHRDIIPEEFLPTFNSTTIEMYLHKIPGLDKKYVYFNDDLFPLKKMKESDFFWGDKPKVGIIHSYSTPRDMFQHQTKGSSDFAKKAAGLEPSNEVVRPEHTAIPFNRELVENFFDSYEEEIRKRCTMIREKKNFNQYVFTDYAYYTENLVPVSLHYKYFSIGNGVWGITQYILNPVETIMCINDSHKLTKRTFENFKKTLLATFQKKFPKKSRFER